MTGTTFESKEKSEGLIKDKLQVEFEQLRVELEEKGMRLGFLNPEVIKTSQRLDLIHNQILHVS
ncbi:MULTISPECIES: aspartyl-phosphate phosphatase Spo0E family protein [unclassified Paenibacillus]|uniref:aspartyl-phosphate phosphatase Spo0E family protein n=1 Tax=unclassified Paenibacillus TaxID=185978 RepID=UPI0030F6A3B5